MAGKYYYKGVDLNNLVTGFSGNVWVKTSSSDDVIGYLKPYSFGYFRGTLDLSTKYAAPCEVYTSSTTLTYTNPSSYYSGYNVILMGGGGSCGKSDIIASAIIYGGGGGSGGFSMMKNIKIQNYTITIGNGGIFDLFVGRDGGPTSIYSSIGNYFDVSGGDHGGNGINNGYGGAYGRTNSSGMIDIDNNSITTITVLNNNNSNGLANGGRGGIGTSIYVDGGYVNERGTGGDVTNSFNGHNGIAYILRVKV